MADERALSDPAIYDLSVELAAVAGRLVALCESKGIHITREDVIESALQAIEREEAVLPDGVVSLAQVRRARGLPATARPISSEASEEIERLDVAFTFEGDRATEVARMAEQLHGEVTETSCTRILASAAERGLSSLRRELDR